MQNPISRTKEGDSVELKLAKLAPSKKFFATPKWIETKDSKCKVASLPTREDIDEGIKENLVIEFYSR